MRRRWALGSVAVVATLGLTFAVAGRATGIVLDGHFVDDNTSQFEEDIDAIAEAGITRGCDTAGPRFCPGLSVTRGEMAAFIRRALNLPASERDWFIDDALSPFEEDINAIAQAGITSGCDVAGTMYCPRALVTRGEMAAFLRRSQNLPAPVHDYFTDDAGSIFEDDINSIAEAGITRGCDSTRTRYCPFGAVSRGQMAAFLRRALSLPAPILRVPMGDHPALTCSPEGNACYLTVDLDAGRQYKVEEGLYQALPADSSEMAEFNSPNTRFILTVDGSAVAMVDLPATEADDLAYRRWQHPVSFTAGNHTLVGRWMWNGLQIQVSTVTVRAGA